LTQGFFAQLLEKNYLAQVSRSRGKFRSFLLASIKHYLANEWNKDHRQKRYPQGGLLSLELELGEQRFLGEAVDETTPEKVYEQSWAVAVMRRANQRLRREYRKQGREPFFDRLEGFLEGERSGTYRELAAEFQVTEGMIRIEVDRLRRRYRELLREEITQTVGDLHQFEEEMKFLVETMTSAAK
jgi:RNA polymerase sigma-70 factor (ECF subfamily)